MIPEGEPIMMGLFLVAKQRSVILFDSGASHTFINRSFAIENQLPIETVDNNLCVQLPGGWMVTREVVYQVPIDLVGHIFPTNLIDLKD
jgi:hypothetical protein